MDKSKLHEKQLQIEQGLCYALEYWLTSRIVLDEGDNEEMLYGVEIAKYNRNSLIEKEGVYCLSYCKAEVEAWIETLAKSEVTPVTLLSLADDFLSSSYA